MTDVALAHQLAITLLQEQKTLGVPLSLISMPLYIMRAAELVEEMEARYVTIWPMRGRGKLMIVLGALELFVNDAIIAIDFRDEDKKREAVDRVPHTRDQLQAYIGEQAQPFIRGLALATKHKPILNTQVAVIPMDAPPPTARMVLSTIWRFCHDGCCSSSASSASVAPEEQVDGTILHATLQGARKALAASMAAPIQQQM